MTSFDYRIEIDLSDERYLRRLYLQWEDGKYRFNQDLDSHSAFPGSIEEAAYFLVGLNYNPYQYDTSWDHETNEKKFLGQLRLLEYMRRDGPLVYQKLCSVLGTEELLNIRLDSLLSWIESEKNRRRLKHFSADLLEQLRLIVQALSIPFPAVDIPSIHWDRDFDNAFEIAYGKPMDDVKIPKGRQSARDKYKVLVLANEWISSHPGATLRKFYDSKDCKDLISSLCIGQPYTLDTVRRWTKHLPFNRNPGSPKRQ